MDFSDIIAMVEEKCEGRSLTTARHVRWANAVRRRVARSAFAGGFHGLYFLYKEATVDGGSVANQSRYQLPDDFVDDLSVWYDGTLLIKADPGVMDITVGVNDATSNANTDAPIWFAMRGRELDVIPTCPSAGKEIKMFYNGLPDAVTSVAFTDYFLEQYQDIHIFGMAEFALDSVGAYNQAKSFRDRFNEELKNLLLDNRRFWLKNQKVRFQNWDEFVGKQRYVFPQFGNLTTIGE